MGRGEKALVIVCVVLRVARRAPEARTTRTHPERRSLNGAICLRDSRFGEDARQLLGSGVGRARGWKDTDDGIASGRGLGPEKPVGPRRG